MCEFVQTEVPGPGNYYKPEAESGESRTSISKLGFGVGFVSKVLNCWGYLLTDACKHAFCGYACVYQG